MVIPDRREGLHELSPEVLEEMKRLFPGQRKYSLTSARISLVICVTRALAGKNPSLSPMTYKEVAAEIWHAEWWRITPDERIEHEEWIRKHQLEIIDASCRTDGAFPLLVTALSTEALPYWGLAEPDETAVAKAMAHRHPHTHLGFCVQKNGFLFAIDNNINKKNAEGKKNKNKWRAERREEQHLLGVQAHHLLDFDKPVKG